MVFARAQCWAVWSLLALNAVVLVVLAPFTGTEIAVPVEKIAKAIVLMADGAILSLALLSEELRPRFR